MPSSDDWMFDITSTSHPLHTPRPQPDDTAGVSHPLDLPSAQLHVAAEVPASVREAVDRFESWSMSQSLQTQAATVLQHEPTEQHRQAVQQPNDGSWQQHAVQQPQQHQPWQHGQAQQQQGPIQQQGPSQQQGPIWQQGDEVQDWQQQHGHDEQQTPQQNHWQEQALHQQLAHQDGNLLKESDEVPQHLPPHLHQDDNLLLQQQQQECRLSRQQAPGHHHSDAVHGQMESEALLQGPPPKLPSHALSLISATLVAINDSTIVATAPTHAQSPHVGKPSMTPSAAAASATGPTAPMAPSHRPPLPARRPGQTVSTRPGFTDASAKPCLYQQPHSQHPDHAVAHISAGPGAADYTAHPTMHTTQPSTAAASNHGTEYNRGGVSRLPTTIRTGASAGVTPRQSASSSHSATPQGEVFNTTAAAFKGIAISQSTSSTSGARRSSLADASTASHASSGSAADVGVRTDRWSAVDAYRQARDAPADITTTSDMSHDRGGGTHESCGGSRWSAMTAYRQPASPDADKEHAADGPFGAADRRFGAGDGGLRHSRWSAVNAYRQAREAAEQAAEGTPLPT